MKHAVSSASASDSPAPVSNSAFGPGSTCEPPKPHHLLEELSISDGAFFRTVLLPLVPGLNCLIGAMGEGKTTLLQSIRYSLGVAATDPRARQNEATIIATLGTGEVATAVRTLHGKGYTSRRRVGELPRIVTETGEHAPVSLDGDLFKIDIYAQNQIFTMSEDPVAQLALLDKFAQSEIRALEEAVAQVDRRLGQNAAEMKRLEDEIEGGAERTRETPSILAALAALTEAAGPDAEEARLAHEAKVLRGREAATLRALREDQHAVLLGANAFEAEAVRKLGGELGAGAAKSPNHAVLLRAHAQSSAALGVIRDAMTRIREALAAGDSAVTAAGDALGTAHAGQDAAYDALVRKHDADRGRIAERERLQKRSLELELLQKRLNERKGEHETRFAERHVLQAERRELLEKRFATRKRVAAEINEALEGVLKVELLAGGDVSAYLALLTDILTGANIRPATLIGDLAHGLRPKDLAALVRANDTSGIQALDDAKTGKVERAQRIIDAIRATGRVAELETVALGDVPSIWLRVNGEDVVSTSLSTGLRCTAILPILLLESINPLIIDQPEDSLDAGFIYRVLVKTLRKVKSSRQIIFATHDPNIVVLGEAERVFLLGREGGVPTVKAFGNVDEMRECIETAMEGGRDAFLLRSQRYGHMPRAGGDDAPEGEAT